MGVKIFSGNTNDRFEAYKEGAWYDPFKDWKLWHIDGGGGNDTLIGGALGDTIFGGTGNDSLFGLDGADYIDAGSGNDTLYGANGYFDAAKDTLIGSSGDDTYYADVTDTIEDNIGYDRLHLIGSNHMTEAYYLASGIEALDVFGSHNEEIYANSSHNFIQIRGFGTSALNNAAVDGLSGDDFMVGSSGYDYLRGGADNDVIYGGGGNDNLAGDGGNDSITGINWSGDNGVGQIDTLTGGSGNDTFRLGEQGKSFYDNGVAGDFGYNDYALITDFKAGEDKILLGSSLSNYYLQETRFSGAGASDQVDTLIRLKNGGELIGVLQDTSGLTLTSPNFYGA